MPVEYLSDPMYTEPSPEVLAKVMAEKVDRRVFRVALKKKSISGQRSTGNVANILPTRRNVTRQANFGDIVLVCRHTFVSLFFDIDVP